MEGLKCRLEELREGPAAGLPCGLQGLGAQALAPRDWIIPRLTSEWPAGTPSLTSVFGLIGRDLRAAHVSAQVPGPDADPLEELACGGPSGQTLTPGDGPPSPSQN